MRYFNIIIYLLLFTGSKSQNLVQNPSFENYLSCNGFFNQSGFTKWYSTKQTPNFFNACAGSNIVSVPVNMSGLNYQQPKTGLSYVGISTYHESIVDDREYFANILNSTLINNNFYKVTFYVANSQCSKFATDLQLSFTSNLSYTSTVGFINLTPHIFNFNKKNIIDTLNWTEIIGLYKANGTEQFITIGNFLTDSNSKFDTTNYNLGCPGAYYYIDDVSVEPICTPFWSYRDTTVSSGDSVLIGPAITGLNINWYDSNNNFIANAPAIYVKPNSPTYYTASEDFCNGITTHTINVMVTPTSVKEYIAFTNSISLFPNPTTNNFTISCLTESSKLKVDITDTQGKLYSTELITISNNKTTIKTNLPNGVYFVSITDTVSGLKAVKKLIVQK